MAFPSSATDDLAGAWSGVRAAAGTIKGMASSLRELSLAGDVEAQRVIRFLAQLADANDTLSRYAGTPGLSAYAQSQIGGTVDIVAEYNTMLAQINATRNWVLTNFPKDADGYILYHKLDGAGRISQRVFSTASLAGLRTQLDALLATIS